MATFLIIPKHVTLFRVKITDLRCELDSPHFGTTGMFLEGDFDMFRTFTTPKVSNSAQFPTWDKYELMFIYQTEFVEMLIAKRFRISLSATTDGSANKSSSSDTACCGCVGQQSMITDFVGEAEVDLMTLATGPDRLVLRLRNGDINVGKITLTVEMEEISEMQADIKNVVFTENGEKAFNFPPIFEISKKGRCDPLKLRSKTRKDGQGATFGILGRQSSSPQQRQDGSPAGLPSNIASFEVPDCTHYFSTSLPDLSEKASLVIDVCADGWLGNTLEGSVEVHFYNHLWMIERHRDPEGLRKKEKKAERDVDDADANFEKAKEALEVAKKSGSATSGELSLLEDALQTSEATLKVAKQNLEEASKATASTVEDRTSGWFSLGNRKVGDAGTASDDLSQQLDPLEVTDAAGKVIGTITGEVHLTHMPRHCQMRAGTTVDGVVCNGLMYDYATIEPPFKSKQYRVTVGASGYA